MPKVVPPHKTLKKPVEMVKDVVFFGPICVFLKTICLCFSYVKITGKEEREREREIEKKGYIYIIYVYLSRCRVETAAIYLLIRKT